MGEEGFLFMKELDPADEDGFIELGNVGGVV